MQVRVYGSLYTCIAQCVCIKVSVLRVYRCIYQGCCSCRVTVYMYTVVYIHVYSTVSMYKSVCVLRVCRCICQGCCSCRVTVYMYPVVYIHVTQCVCTKVSMC